MQDAMVYVLFFTVTSQHSVETTEQIELAFVTVASFHLSCAVTVSHGNLVTSRVLLSGTYFQTWDLELFRHGTWTITSIVKLSSISDSHQFITLSSEYLCVKHDGCDAAHCVGPSVAAETY